MEIHAILPLKGRDLRLDLFRGVANWAIFLDHIPDNAVNWITTRNYGFSDAADLFVFISGYTASFVYAKMTIDRGFIVGATRLFRRVWQLYVAHVVLLFIYIASVGNIAMRFNAPDFVNEFNVSGLIDNAVPILGEGLLLRYKPLNLDVLPLYIVLMAFFPAALWMMLRRPDLTMLGSFVLYLAARHFGWNLSGYPAGSWYFNPFTWQVLFRLGAWSALGGSVESRPVINSRVTVYLGCAYLVFACFMTMAGRFPSVGSLLPLWLFDAFIPNDKTNLAPYRLLHFIVLVMLVTHFVPRDARALELPIFRPLIKCGQQSLADFCVGVFLSFVTHIALSVSSGSILSQILFSAAGIVAMTVVAYYISWSKRQDKPAQKLAASPVTALAIAPSPIDPIGKSS